MSRRLLKFTSSEEEILATKGYKIRDQIGQGSYASVYLGRYISNRYNQPQVACKVIDINYASKDFVQTFLPRELSILMKVKHPHIIQVFSILQRKTKYYIFQRYAENGDMLEYVLRSGVVPEEQARIWQRQITLAVQYLHELNIAHRDLKCENILLTKNFNVKVADFGFARHIVYIDGKMQLSNTYCGSLSYAAPEVIRGKPYNMKMADIWSLGVILFVMINQAMPFEDSSPKRLYSRQMSRKWRFRSKINSTISQQLKNVIRNLLEPNLKARWTLAKVINSDWIAMDSRLTKLDPNEEMCLEMAKKETVPPMLSRATLSTQSTARIRRRNSLITKKSSKPNIHTDKQSKPNMIKVAAEAAAAKETTVNVIKDLNNSDIHYHSTQIHLVSDKDSDTTSLKQYDANTTSLKYNDADTTSLKQNDADTTSLKQNDADTTSLKQNDADTNSLKQNDLCLNKYSNGVASSTSTLTNKELDKISTETLEDDVTYDMSRISRTIDDKSPNLSSSSVDVNATNNEDQRIMINFSNDQESHHLIEEPLPQVHHDEHRDAEGFQGFTPDNH
uniref:Protein kinase domain-containing protein n=1 Tax=Timema cristinae TaxID=61476 RepID=A0A7R9CUS0_TIMCR|nr:unnamed protein product [Timema cristinae]